MTGCRDRHPLLGQGPFLLAIELLRLDTQPTPSEPVKLFSHGHLDGPTAIPVEPGLHPAVDLLDGRTRKGDARYRELEARLLAIASTMGAGLGEGGIRRAPCCRAISTAVSKHRAAPARS